MRVVVDREGKVRSVDDFFSDNPGLQQAAQEQLLKWHFRPSIPGSWRSGAGDLNAYIFIHTELITTAENSP
jgi:hypothetical protein